MPPPSHLAVGMPLPDASPTLPSFRKQHLLVEFSSLRFAQLDGVFVSITPGDPSLWVGIIFVRKGTFFLQAQKCQKRPSLLVQLAAAVLLLPPQSPLYSLPTGPYAPAVLRFQISFPASYPSLPPLVTFSTDVFHPLLTPLTTYTYTTGSSDTDTVSATDEERLPPGGFSLRHGFPQWFGRARRSAASSRNVSGSGLDSPTQSHTPVLSPDGKHGATATTDMGSIAGPLGKDVSIVRVLEYIRTTFSDERVLDSIPVEAAANPGAYHAWRAYRAASLQAQQIPPNAPTSSSQANSTGKTNEGSTLGRNRRPGEWNWEGVWEERVRKAVKASLSEPVLFGGPAGEDIIRFRDAGEEAMAKMKEQLELVLSRTAV